MAGRPTNRIFTIAFWEALRQPPAAKRIEAETGSERG
jgi:hypothetical protein